MGELLDEKTAASPPAVCRLGLFAFLLRPTPGPFLSSVRKMILSMSFLLSPTCHRGLASLSLLSLTLQCDVNDVFFIVQ